MSGAAKWNDSAIKDLTFAILMSTNNGSMNVNANWDKVAETMSAWGYNFTKSAMSQHWTKRVLKEFRERHPDPKNRGGGGPVKKGAAGPKAARIPKAPASGSGKKRRAKDMEDDDEDDGDVANPIARNKAPRTTAIKKVKYEELEDEEDEGEDGDEGMEARAEAAAVKAEATNRRYNVDDFGV